MEHPKFRAAFDFLLLRNRVERGLGELASWWERYVESNPDVRPQLQREATREGEGAPAPAGEKRSGNSNSRNRRRPRRRKPKAAE
ncbi:poly(A) polymerase I [compost metagenome]